MTTPLLINTETRLKILEVQQLAQMNLVDMTILRLLLSTPEGKQAHMEQMTMQTMHIPTAFMATYSIEIGHPIGTCRHLSLSVQKEGRIPHPQALLMVAREFGFKAESLNDFIGIWHEDLKGHGQAINVVQKMELVEC